MRSYGQTRCIDQQKPTTQIKMKDARKYRAIYCMTCRTGHRSSDKIWSMKVVLWSHGRDTSSSSHELPMESRAKVEPGSSKHGVSVSTHFPKDPNCDICLKTKITRASCRRRAGTVVCRAEHFGDLIPAYHKFLSKGSESRNNHRYAVVQDLATQWIQSYPCKKTSQETQKSLMKFLEPTRKPKVIYTDNSSVLGKSCEELSWNHCAKNATQIENKWDCRKSSAQSERRDVCGAIAVRSGKRMVGRFHGMLHLSVKRHRSLV